MKPTIRIASYPRSHWVTLKPVPKGEQAERCFRCREDAERYASAIIEKHGGAIHDPPKPTTWPWDSGYRNDGSWWTLDR